MGKLRVGDFACGTGALLSAVYDQIAARHERAGGDLAALHPVMLEEVLYGCDVMPSAIHITGSTLSGAQPNKDFGKSRLYTMPYGRQDDKTVKIGSLELLQGSEVQTLFNTSDPALRTGSAGEETAAQVNVDVPDGGFDLVIMNPPFTRNTNKSGVYADTFAGAFAGLNASNQDQRDMAKRLTMLKEDTCYHGHAGLSSAFAGLAHRKLKKGGVLALIIPLSATSGFAWQSFRQMLSTKYSDVIVVTLAAAGNDDLSFSADTGMAECLVIARKYSDSGNKEPTVTFVSLNGRPSGLAEANYIAKSFLKMSYIRRIEDGPYGGSLLNIGASSAGEVLTASCSPDGEVWGAVRISDFSLAQTAHLLSDSSLWLPGSSSSMGIDMVRLRPCRQNNLVQMTIARIWQIARKDAAFLA